MYSTPYLYEILIGQNPWKNDRKQVSIEDAKLMRHLGRIDDGIEEVMNEFARLAKNGDSEHPFGTFKRQWRCYFTLLLFQRDEAEIQP